MAEGIKISEMETIETLKNSCLIPIVDEGVNKKVNFEKLKDFMISIVYPVGAKNSKHNRPFNLVKWHNLVARITSKFG